MKPSSVIHHFRMKLFHCRLPLRRDRQLLALIEVQKHLRKLSVHPRVCVIQRSKHLQIRFPGVNTFLLTQVKSGLTPNTLPSQPQTLAKASRVLPQPRQWVHHVLNGKYLFQEPDWVVRSASVPWNLFFPSFLEWYLPEVCCQTFSAQNPRENVMLYTCKRPADRMHFFCGIDRI